MLGFNLKVYFRAAALVTIICAGVNLNAAAAAQEEADVVSLDEARPSPSPTIAPTSTYSPVPTQEPSPVPTAAISTPKEADTKASKENLADPGFDLSKSVKGGNEDDGLVIIAPGAASPEDSLEAFGIDTPFNWKEKKKRAIAAPAGSEATMGSEDSIELNAPETSDLKDQVSVEAPGKGVSEAENYDAVERAGFILPLEDFRFDAVVTREKNGHLIYGKGDVVYMQMAPGRQVYPGASTET